MAGVTVAKHKQCNSVIFLTLNGKFPYAVIKVSLLSIWSWQIHCFKWYLLFTMWVPIVYVIFCKDTFTWMCFFFLEFHVFHFNFSKFYKVRRKFKGNSTIKLQWNANNSWKSCIPSIFRGENIILAHSKFFTVVTKFS